MSGGLQGGLRAALAVSLVFGGALTATVMGATPAWAQPAVTLYVALGGSGDCTSQVNACGSIEAAISTATGGSYPGDDVTIDVGAGTYTEDDSFDPSSLDSLTIAGAGASSTFWSGTGSGTVVDINSGAVNISGMTIENGNDSSSGGGGIYNDGSTLTVSDSDFSSNTSTFYGGAIWSSGPLTVTDTGFTGNSSTLGGYGAGGILVGYGSSATISGSTFSSNTAAGRAGGIFNLGTLTVANSTFVGNTTTTFGGGIESNAGTTTLTNSTLSGNSAAFGGGDVWNNSGSTMSIGATILANSSSSGEDCGTNGSITDEGYNIDDDGSCGFTSPSISNSGLLDGTLGSLANNGGPTQTMALEPGNPAIGLVANAPQCPGTDQRGAARASSSPCDAGAYDTNGAAFNPSISGVAIGGTLASPTVTVTGSGFGNEADLGVPVPAYCGGSGFDYGNNFYFSDGWGAGQGSGASGDCTGVIISSYSDSQVTFTFGNGYGNGYDPGEYGALSYGDSFQMNLLGGAYSGSVPPYPTTPTIPSVTITGSLVDPTVTVSGSGFGAQGDVGSPASAASCSNTNTGANYGDYFYFADTSAAWQAGLGTNCIGVSISSYTDSQVTFTFGNGYGTGNNQYGILTQGDSFQMTVLGTTYNGTVPFLATPTIGGVTFGGGPTNPTVTVSGSGFGTQSDLGTPVPATSCSNSNTGFDYGNSFYFSDASPGALGPWHAGQAGDCTGFLISSYTDNQIV
ncbi:MAG: choice-of-anchor Q domain-containing protein, partial [Acidimicrobiales bacterium]